MPIKPVAPIVVENLRVHGMTTVPAAASQALPLDTWASIATIIAAVAGIGYTIYSAYTTRAEHRKKMELLDKQILPAEPPK